jgi:hypothetical protein
VYPGEIGFRIASSDKFHWNKGKKTRMRSLYSQEVIRMLNSIMLKLTTLPQYFVNIVICCLLFLLDLDVICFIMN